MKHSCPFMAQRTMKMSRRRRDRPLGLSNRKGAKPKGCSHSVVFGGDFQMKITDKVESGMERCVRCTLPITWETLYFDDEGVCNICRNWDAKQKTVNWDDSEKQLLKIIEDR